MAGLAGVLKGVLSNLSSPLLNEFWLLWGVGEDKVKLQSNLSAINAVLQDAERRQVNDMAVKDWLGKIKAAAHDAEDVLDEFRIEALRRKVENQEADCCGIPLEKVSNLINQPVFHIKMAHKMQKLRKNFEHIAKERDLCKFTEGVVVIQPRISSARETCSKSVSEVYGRNTEKADLIKLLIKSENEEDLSVISIVGMGGLGKTTLAQLVYNDEKSVATHFDLKMWVYVSENFDVRKLLKEILESAIQGRAEQLSMDIIQNRLQKELSGKRYLLVLDDVWNENSGEWRRLKELLPCGAIGSKILVTTRSDIVARIMNALPGPPLGTLSADESWALFEKVAHPRTAAFVSIGEDILKKCGGVPLAIKTLGGMLLNVPSEREWQSVRDSELWKTQDHDGGILPALRLSYDYLTPSLKQCFAYCAVIPKGEAIDKDKLIKQWIAQGFIHSEDENELLEEGGEEYFNALLRRSLFQDDVDNHSYKMHDLIHDLLKSVAGKECLVVEASTMNDLTRGLALFNDETRHLALCNDEWEGEPKNLDALKKCKKLRSMITYRYYCPIDINVCLSFRCLRVLDLSHNGGIHFLPNSIDKLRHLRYFDISYTEITELPETICNLHNLQTLSLFGICLQKLPKNMKRMISLRHIEFDGLPKGIGKLTFLRTMQNSKIILTKESGDQIEELRDLNMLRGNIHIGGLDNITNVGCAGEADLKAKKHVNSLKLSWSGNETVAAEGNAKEVIEMLEPHSDLKELSVENYTGLGFPSWMTEKLTNLKKISLSSCKRCEWLPPLGQLDLLESLEIDTMDAVKHIVEFDGSHNYIDLFPSLKDLRLRNMPNLEGWSSPQEDGDEQGRERDKQVIFKCLRTLSISNCPKLICLPMFLLPALEELKMSEVGCESIECSRSHSLKSIILFNMPNLERWSLQEVDDDKDEQVTFRSLCTLNIFKCPKLICLPQLLVPALERLQMGEVGCESIEFSRSHSLKSINLFNMPNLERWSLQEVDDDKDEQVTFRSLCTLNISKCPKLICLLLFPALERLQMSEVGCERIEFSRSHSLKSINLFNMPNLERWSLQEVDDDKDEQVTFRSLCTLNISKCPKLICLPQLLVPALERLQMTEVGCERIEFSRSHSLKSVSLRNMPNLERWSLQEVDDDKDEQVTFRSLCTLNISKCLKLICLPQLLVPALERLQMTEVGCERIEFSRSHSLKSVSLRNMPNLERWSLQEVDDDKDKQVTFRSLCTLRISECPKLICLPQFLLPALEELKMEGVGCEKIEFFTSKSLKKVELTKMPNLERWSPQQADDDDEQVVFDDLVELVVKECPKMVRLPHFLPSLEKLKISESNEMLLRSVANYTSLFKLSIYGLPEVKHLPGELGPNHNGLRILEIEYCPKLTSVSNQLANLLGLKELAIKGCNDLVLSLPDGLQQQQQRSRPLKSLQVLKITNSCENQISLPGDGIVLTSLRSLTIVSCGNLESISADMLQNLTSLEIKGCPKLSSSLENLKSIKTLMISGCPDMTRLLGSMENLTSLRLLSIIDCPGLWSLPESTVKNLKSLTSLRIENCPGISSLPESMGDLESGIVLTSLRSLTIVSCGNLESISADMLQNLTSLEIEGCPKLSSSLENLKSMVSLMISGCPDMTRLLGSMENLTSLRLLSIIDCPGMWSLPESTVKNLKSLTSLRIENCPGISSLPESMGDLESLTSLRIENCPGITTLPHGLKRLRKLNHLQIEECPNFKKKTAIP